jgi:hypothetical protein
MGIAYVLALVGLLGASVSIGLFCLLRLVLRLEERHDKLVALLGLSPKELYFNNPFGNNTERTLMDKLNMLDEKDNILLKYLNEILERK